MELFIFIWSYASKPTYNLLEDYPQSMIRGPLKESQDPSQSPKCQDYIHIIGMFCFFTMILPGVESLAFQQQYDILLLRVGQNTKES